MSFYAMLRKNQNTFGGLVDRKGVREFFGPNVIDWGKNDFGFYWVTVAGKTVCGGLVEADVDNAVAYYANQQVQRNLSK